MDTAPYCCAFVSIRWKSLLLYDAVCIRDSSLVFILWNEENGALVFDCLLQCSQSRLLKE
jgi:hypothetical protein